MTLPTSVALIGFGEAGRTFARDLKALGVTRLAAFDPAFADPAGRASREAAQLGVERFRAAAAAANGCDLVVSAVTAEAALGAARDTAPGLGRGAFFLDLNSASPAVKLDSSRAVEAAGGRYVEAAVMGPIPPKGLRVAMLLGGPHAADFLAFAADLPLEARAYSDTVGAASAAKLARSVMMKGMEALITECLLMARRWGIERDVLDSLNETYPLPDWEARARYMISRTLLHGARRAEEMREAARTVADAGIPPILSVPTAARQARSHEIARRGVSAEAPLAELLDAMLAAERALRDPKADEAVPGPKIKIAPAARRRGDRRS